MENQREEVYRTIRTGIENISGDSLFFQTTEFNPKSSLETISLSNSYITPSQNLASELIYDLSEVYNLDEEALLMRLRKKGYQVSQISERIPYEKLTPKEIADIILAQEKKEEAA